MPRALDLEYTTVNEPPRPRRDDASCNLRRAAAPREGVVAGTFMCARFPDGGVAL